MKFGNYDLIEFLYAFKYILRQISEISFQYWIISILISVIFIILTKKLLCFKRKYVRILSFGILEVYVSMIIHTTIFNRTIMSTRVYKLFPLWSWIEWLSNGNISMLIENLLNILLFIPFGFLYGLTFCKSRKISMFVCSCILSYTIEFAQLLLKKGVFELLDDPLNNLIGCTVGYLLFRLIKNAVDKTISG